ncbi:hypothetical protein C1I98_23970 [Spongiactinospora gelatinilytica]|uniref:DoxX family protein n=1 Tax=Spongiactinospora gelatinilytica TaxID=2666298 RepID=A0A2W2FT44_9ACTN|nr:DoxX family protein [Spongiactinospora gelatinilytica]PZG38891.1 hypothetical protein C1I98_23970 [Spongiactinospora gelatinilytica]
MRRWLYDIAALIARLIVGVIFMAHGLQKIRAGGVGPTAAGFAEMGIPMPQVAAGLTMAVELIGGALLILGLITPLAALLLAVVCAAAAIFVHARNGIFISDGGFELVGGLGSAALLLAAGGGPKAVTPPIWRTRPTTSSAAARRRPSRGHWTSGPRPRGRARPAAMPHLRRRRSRAGGAAKVSPALVEVHCAHFPRTARRTAYQGEAALGCGP